MPRSTQTQAPLAITWNSNFWIKIVCNKYHFTNFVIVQGSLCVLSQNYFLEKFGFQEPFGLELLLLAVAVVAKYSFVDIAFIITIAKLNLSLFGLCPEFAVHLVLILILVNLILNLLLVLRILFLAILDRF